MERGDLQLNVSCSRLEPERNKNRLPLRMPDGTKIENKPNLVKKMHKTHHPVGNVFVPNHKLPVLDEFGLSRPKDHVGFVKPTRLLPSLTERETSHAKKGDSKNDSAYDRNNDFEQTDSNASHLSKSILRKQSTVEESSAASHKEKRRKRKKREQEPMIIPKEVQAVAGGLPPSFPKHTIKKFTEEYQMKKRKQLEEGEDDDDDETKKKKRRSFVPGLNPRKREKASHLFTESTLDDLEDLHPYLASNLKQNYGIEKLTKIQSLAMPELLKTRFNSSKPNPIYEYTINSGVGSGKILSYVVPIINNLALIEPKINRTSGIYALVLLPTRELAAKVNDIFVNLCRSFLWIVPGLLTGGERKKSEKARLRKGLNILITTPGRLIDHIEHSKSLEFTKLKYCVLAEVHRLLDPERAEVAKKIAIVLKKKLPRDCVKCIVTATTTKKIEKLTEIIAPSPKIIDAFKEFE